jgi:hypothetical protein
MVYAGGLFFFAYMMWQEAGPHDIHINKTCFWEYSHLGISYGMQE